MGIASGEIDDSRVIKDDDEDRESIVEKDQIEEMETSPHNNQDKDFGKPIDDDEDVELQRIKDEDDEDNQERIPDIGEDDCKKEPAGPPPKDLALEEEPPKVAYSHVKTPDEVDDLPEHEVVNPDECMIDEIKSEMSYDLEEKIAKDESEKENYVDKNDKSEGSVEALKENEEVEVLVEQKSVPDEKEEDKSEAKESKIDVKSKDEEDVHKDVKVTSSTDEKAEKKIASEKIDKAGYKLRVTVVEAVDLINKDKIGKSDPYVIVKFQDQEFRSSTVKNSLSPKWNFISSFKVSSEETENIKFDVYDDDFGKDELQGSFSISLADAFDEAPDTKWFDLKECKTGKIAISFEFNDEVESDIDDDKKAEIMAEGGKEENMEALTEAEAKAEEKEDT